jgi:signal transduction histidine kinase
LISRANTDYPASGDMFSTAPSVRMISAIRFVLAGSGLSIILIDPSQPDPLVGLTFTLLAVYTAYSFLICAISYLAPRFMPLGKLHWIDLIWYVALVSVSGGTNSVFFFFFFFAILVASFRGGFSEGLWMAAASTMLFTFVGFLSAPPEPQFELNRTMLRPLSLLVLGYMIAYWGGSDVTLKRRLQLLKDITGLSNPRFGIDRTITLSEERLRSYYDADVCLLIQPVRNEWSYRLTRVDRGGPDKATFTKETELANILLSGKADTAVVYDKRASKLLHYDPGSGKFTKEPVRNVAAIANALDTKAFVSVPIFYRGLPSGRLYVIGSPRQIDKSEIEFILQIIEQLIPLLDNIRLVDRLATDAAEQERQKLARDIHDSVIQPFVGLQLGLNAVREKLAHGNGDALRDINELCLIASDEMRELREYVERLKSRERLDSVLIPAIRRFASKYSAATGITVQVKGMDNLYLNDRLAGEAFQIVAEGLSNVRRHTSARNAEIELLCDKTDLILRIMNDNSNSAASATFQPGSISERAVALGGDAQVYFDDDDDRTVVDVRIPL